MEKVRSDIVAVGKERSRLTCLRHRLLLAKMCTHTHKNDTLNESKMRRKLDTITSESYGKTLFHGNKNFVSTFIPVLPHSFARCSSVCICTLFVAPPPLILGPFFYFGPFSLCLYSKLSVWRLPSRVASHRPLPVALAFACFSQDALYLHNKRMRIQIILTQAAIESSNLYPANNTFYFDLFYCIWCDEVTPVAAAAAVHRIQRSKLWQQLKCLCIQIFC